MFSNDTIMGFAKYNTNLYVSYVLLLLSHILDFNCNIIKNLIWFIDIPKC